MTNNTSKFYITLKLKFIPPDRFLALKKDKFVIRCNRNSPFCLTFENYESANKFLVDNYEYFTNTDCIQSVKIKSFDVKTIDK